MGTHTDTCTKFIMCTSTAVPAVEINLVLSQMRIINIFQKSANVVLHQYQSTLSTAAPELTQLYIDRSIAHL